MIVQEEVLTMGRSYFRVDKNHFQLLVSSTSTTANATGKMQSFGSIPIAVSNIPPNLVFK
jgi:hypothetical protein